MRENPRRGGIFAGTAVVAALLLSTLTACAAEGSASGPAADRVPQIALQAGASSLGKALAGQATTQNTAAEEAATERGDPRTATLPTDGEGLCTTDPADRQNCRNPAGTIDPNGGDLDGDGVFEADEPVGPGYKDPRAYDGGRTSGETQCEWLRSQGIAC
ncbi:hypothetical protein AB0903_10670 [Streptomyces sp. NPDC048389]|uniref:hypothetical protein n=1 Tax=Streptomyces sp. NPDC048389 TaxID=3154622 RepID=UPI0034570774